MSVTNKVVSIKLNKHKQELSESIAIARLLANAMDNMKRDLETQSKSIAPCSMASFIGGYSNDVKTILKTMEKIQEENE